VRRAASTDVTVLCMYDYTAGGAEMLSFKQGERLSVIERPNDDWWLAVRDGTQGWVPAAYVQIQ
jgi:myosin-1